MEQPEDLASSATGSDVGVFVPEQAVSVTEALRIPPSAIRDLKVLKTIVGGRVVYQAPATDGGAKTAGKPEPSAR